ncbi:CLUMA_CG020283, isoform A [Clunio marinus]|uniref:CLUMA_CG020283, isoform A n=1 Tax=Clunio marinus TaxID=568069 RepID=A0A1J1J8R3_9DIPT|nr:CLUMA_CG020283, isoform A [Clunio marinus]
MSEDESMEDSIVEEEEEEEEEEDDSSSESFDEELKLTKNFVDALARIELNKSNYDDYVLLVDIAHDLTDLDKIRQSIELFSQAFPLSPEIWLRYLKVEAAVAQSEEEIDELQNLFERALNDYYSVDVALEYAILASRCNNTKAREIWEQLLPAYGYEYSKGRLMWAAWRDDYIRREPDSPEKLKKIIKRFKEELLLPLNQIQLSYNEFREFIEKCQSMLPNFDRDSIDSEFKTTKTILQKVMPFEQKLSHLEAKSHQERVDIFKTYINECAEELEEEYVQVLYERMITACCLNESVWKEYLSYIQNRSKDWTPMDSNKSKIFRQSDMDIVTRGLRNCSWSADLYIEKMRIFEQNKKSRQDIQSILETACAIQYNNAEPVVKVWLEYLSYLVRVTNFQDNDEKEVLRKNFNLAWNTLGWQYGNLADCECEILKFWGRVEYEKFEDGNQGKQLWNTVMESNDNYTKTGLWLEFVAMEQKFRGTEGARLIYKRASKVPDLNDMSTLIYSWIRFERCFGSLSHIRFCQETCEKMLRQNRKKHQSGKRKVEAKKDGKRKAEDDSQHQNKKMKEATSVSKEEFKKMSISKPKESNENGDIDLSKDNVRVFFSNLDYNVTTDDLKEAFPEITIISFNVITTGKGKSRGFGYAELSSEEDVKKALSMDRRMLAGRPVFISRCERDKTSRESGFKYSSTLEPNKVFVKGISFEASNEDLKKLFGEFGTIKDVRIVTNKAGKSKGIAYIVYDNDKSASTAVMKLDQKEFMDRVLSVAISAPPPVDKHPQAKTNVSSFSGSRKATQKTEQKSRISFIPASVQKASAADTKTLSSTPAMSNDDFRKMIMK